MMKYIKNDYYDGQKERIYGYFYGTHALPNYDSVNYEKPYILQAFFKAVQERKESGDYDVPEGYFQEFFASYKRVLNLDQSATTEQISAKLQKLVDFTNNEVEPLLQSLSGKQYACEIKTLKEETQYINSYLTNSKQRKDFVAKVASEKEAFLAAYEKLLSMDGREEDSGADTSSSQRLEKGMFEEIKSFFWSFLKSEEKTEHGQPKEKMSEETPSDTQKGQEKNHAKAATVAEFVFSKVWSLVSGRSQEEKVDDTVQQGKGPDMAASASLPTATPETMSGKTALATTKYQLDDKVVENNLHTGFQMYVDAYVDGAKQICFATVLKNAAAYTRCRMDEVTTALDEAREKEANCAKMKSVFEISLTQCQELFPMASASDAALDEFLEKTTRVSIDYQDNHPLLLTEFYQADLAFAMPLLISGELEQVYASIAGSNEEQCMDGCSPLAIEG